MKSPKRKYISTLLILIGAIIILSRSVYFESLKEHQKKLISSKFDPLSYAKEFWQRLPGEYERAIETSTLFNLLTSDMSFAIKTYGKTLGVSRSHSFLVKGKGQVCALESDSFSLVLENDVKINIALDFIFGNQVRDASGIINVSDFPNTMEFNNISSEINNIIKIEVIKPFIKNFKVGEKIKYIGALQISEDNLDLEKLRVIPIKLEMTDSQIFK